MPAKKKTPGEGLKAYRAKRSTEGTPEPFGSSAAQRPRLFVVQKHAATRLHYDFRLEWGGTLWSWAVPKGPSPDPRHKRMAVHVEDHPVEYADFEGTIPKGNYGAGAVIVWDRGLWTPIDDPDQAMETGKLHFLLKGYKLQGEWILVRTKRSPKDWLLMKKADAWSREVDEGSGEGAYPEESVLSGLSLEELRDGSAKASSVRAKLSRWKVPRKSVDPMKVKLMLAETAEKPFSRKGWVFELKYDGYRVVASRDAEGRAVLRSRNGKDFTETYPEIARVMEKLPYEEVVLDGELVCLDASGKPDFGRLQKRAQLRRRIDVEKAVVGLPASFFAFDLLEFEGFDLRGLPLVKRKEVLKEVLPSAGAVRFADHVAEQGVAMYEAVGEMGLEGIMAKKADSSYRGVRSGLWLKMPLLRTGDFVVVGYTAGEGSRVGFGALHLGVYEDGVLVYAGRVGTGFSDRQLAEYGAALEGLRRKTRPFEGPGPEELGSGMWTRGSRSGPGKHFWVKPEWVVEVRYKTVTGDGLLRQPAFLRVRDDKDAKECVREPVERSSAGDELVGAESGAGETEKGKGKARGKGSAKGKSKSKGKASAASPKAEERRVQLSNLDKVFWPDEGYTKGDLIAYYVAVKDWILPYLKDRPLVLTRYPDGIEGKSFYQKNAPDFIPSWVRTESIWSGSSEREIKYLVCDDEDMLVYIINSGAIPLHLWSSRVTSIQKPDWCILDLDPKGAPFKHVVILAKAIKKLCDQIGLPAFVKTSGSTGLHVLIPLGGLCTYEQSRTLGHLIARYIAAEHGEIATIARTLAARRGKVYLDFLQNRHGQLLVSPYCVRPLPGAPVSAPLEWGEVNGRLDPQKFNLKNVLPRLKRKKKDPLLPVLTVKPDLMGALAKLARLTR